MFLNFFKEKFGDILASNGGRIYGLYDELLSFFASHNILSSKSQKISDNKEQQDLLSMFNGKGKRRFTCKYQITLVIGLDQLTLISGSTNDVNMKLLSVIYIQNRSGLLLTSVL